MNETNTDQRQEPKTSKFVYASLICLAVFFGLICAMSALSILVGLGSTIFSGYPVENDMAEGPTWFEQVITFCTFSLSGTIIATLILGIAALIHIRLSKGRLCGISLAVSAIFISAAIGGFLLISPDVKFLVWRDSCASSLKRVGASLQSYASYYGGQLPTGAEWCDLLITQMNISAGSFVCSEICNTHHGESCYALNKNVVGIKLSEVPEDVVLVFETKPGWNQFGGSDILDAEHHQDRGCNILFAGGSVRFVKTKDLGGLRWEP